MWRRMNLRWDTHDLDTSSLWSACILSPTHFNSLVINNDTAALQIHDVGDEAARLPGNTTTFGALQW